MHLLAVARMAVRSLLAFAGLAAAKPNFVVLFVDDMGINQVAVDKSIYASQVYGYTGDSGTIATPNVARLAKEGLLFQTWYSSFHLCSPSRASMLTGRHSIRSGVGVPCGAAEICRGSGGNQVFTAEAIGGLPLNETTTAEVLSEAGYESMAIGKWHVGQRKQFLPTNRGFGHYLGIPFSQDMGTSAWLPIPSEPWKPVPLPLLNGTTVIEQPVDLGSLTQKYAKAAVDFVSNAPGPFYLYAAFNHVHAPNTAGSAFCGKSPQGAVGDAVEEVDWAIGQIMDAVRSRVAKEGDNTLVLFTSDNGAPTGIRWGNDSRGNLPLRGAKAQLWEGGFREPAIAWGRGVRKGLTQAIASTLDVHTTLLSQAGVKLPEDRIIDGIDLTDVLAGRSEQAHECYPFYNEPDSHNASSPFALSAVRCGNHKAYWFTNGEAPPAGRPAGLQEQPLLFNLVSDPGENQPVDEQSPEYVQALKRIAAWREQHIQTVQWVQSQTELGSDPSYAICSPISCNLTPENWQPASVCSVDICKRRQGLVKQCQGELLV